MEPPSRVSAWRLGLPTKIHYTDNEFNCGGFSRQGGSPPHFPPFFLSLGLAIRKKVSMFLSQSEVYLGFTNVKNKSTDNPRTYIFGIALFVNLASKPQTNAVETERGQMRGVR